MSDHNIHDCCLKGFEWDGKTAGTLGKLADNEAYITGNSSDMAVLFISDILGWKYNNSRILADHYAREAQATVYLPDFFGGEELSTDLILQGRFDKLDMAGWSKRNGRDARQPEIIKCAEALRAKYKRVVAVGFCYGGWASFVLGAKDRNLIDALAVGHPTFLTKEDIDKVDVPVLVLAPEHDPAYTPELKAYTFSKLSERNIAFAYEYFPGMEHGFATRGDVKNTDTGKALERGKNAMVAWMKLCFYQK